MKCIFCDIVAKKAKARVIYEDAQVMAFLDNYPTGRGHTLVIPREHYVNILDIPKETLKRVTEKTQELAVRYKAVLKADGFNVMQSSGAHAGQSVMHYHMHLVPRYEKDGLKLGLHGENDDKKFDLDEVFEEITKG